MQDFVLFALVGLVAQLVDGALGMAYGVISTTVLLAFGVGPAHASAAIHAAEMFTTDWRLFVRLVPFGVAGGLLGTYVLTSFEGNVVKPIVTAYLVILGVWLFIRSFRKIPSRPVGLPLVGPLSAAGGFLDAAGGGGWGPIVTTGLLGAGGTPRYVIGTVNASEFLITLAVSIGFLTALLSGHWQEAGGILDHAYAVGGLIVGGLIAAPFAGWVIKTVPEKLLLRLVGVLITLLAAYQTGQLFGYW
jgi:uncharacterized protein